MKIKSLANERLAKLHKQYVLANNISEITFLTAATANFSLVALPMFPIEVNEMAVASSAFVLSSLSLLAFYYTNNKEADLYDELCNRDIIVRTRGYQIFPKLVNKLLEGTKKKDK